MRDSRFLLPKVTVVIKKCLPLFYLIALAVLGCSHYQSSVGRYKKPSDYLPQENFDRSPAQDMTDKSPQTYLAQHKFELFWPVSQINLSRGFKPSRDPDHQGIDLSGRLGTPILAAHEGLVIYAGKSFRGYGNMVLIEYDPQWATLYGHLDTVLVKTGSIVRAGDKIASMGNTGRSRGVHLHFELMHFKQPVDPLNYLDRAQRMMSRSHRPHSKNR